MSGWIGFVLMVASLPALGIAALLWGCDSRECSEDWSRRHSWSVTPGGRALEPWREGGPQSGLTQQAPKPTGAAVSSASRQDWADHGDSAVPAWGANAIQS